MLSRKNTVKNTVDLKPPKFRFYLEPKNADDEKRFSEELIMVSISYGYSAMTSNGKIRNIPCRISLEAKIKPQNFGRADTGYKFDPKVFEKYSRTNKTVAIKINRLKEVVWKLESHYATMSIMPTRHELKDKLLVALNRKNRVDSFSTPILQFLKEEISRYEIGVGRFGIGKIKESTIKTYRTLRTLIEEYELATGETLQFEEFTKDKYWELWNVSDEILRDVRQVINPNRSKKQTKREEGYKINSIRKYQDALLKTLRNAQEFGFTPAFDINIKGLKLPSVGASKDIYISCDDIEILLKSDVSYDPTLHIVKNFILVSCLTGMRYQSMIDTTNQKVRTYKDQQLDFKYIISKQQKTETEVYMPLLEPVVKILEEYEGEFPKWPANGSVNKKLKQLFEEVGIDSLATETIATYSQGIVTKEKPKYELVSAHDGRRSFITNLELLNANREIVDQMTHPDKTPKNPMRKIYDKRDLMSKAKRFVEEIQKLKSDIYRV